MWREMVYRGSFRGASRARVAAWVRLRLRAPCLQLFFRQPFHFEPLSVDERFENFLDVFSVSQVAQSG